ncbi:MAG TPA: hypothetical protein PLE99_05530 [Candidatus Thiothrix moscowensis]|uniref:hypothetical protein n=1 Tax=unclassified Thiothrix TaxID=2636184 RepID=UPI0025EBF141|nr:MULTISPECIES: hypothetical protein [unclassified Thiothrix]HRJ52204.1 hypothetical protein [Candidatus Thiothrix moscowensis]HRJ92519.1 hypothetical protein [Candidatus Thiothrix moscowensis]
MMASIIQDRESLCVDDHIFQVEDADDYDNLAWVKVGSHLVYLRLDECGTLVVRVLPADGSDKLHGELIVPAQS